MGVLTSGFEYLGGWGGGEGARHGARVDAATTHAGGGGLGGRVLSGVGGGKRGRAPPPCPQRRHWGLHLRGE